MELSFTEENLNLEYISNDELLFRTETLVQTERKIMHLVLTHILEIMDRTLYAEMGFDSMYTMMTKKYGYSEPSALRRIDAAKLLRKVPDVAERLKAGTLNLSQAVLLQKCLESEAKKGELVSEIKTQEILEKLENCNGFETRQVLAQEFDMPLKIQEIVRPQKDESVRLEITFTKEQFEELKKAKSLLSHIAHTGAMAEVIAVLARKFNQSKLGKPDHSVQIKNPVKIQIEAGSVSSNQPPFGSATELRETMTVNKKPKLKPEKVSLPSPLSKRAYISVPLKRKLYSEAKGCCQYESPEGSRCGSQFQIQIDHVTPVSWGGTTSRENLRLLCRTHNLLAARQLGLH